MSYKTIYEARKRTLAPIIQSISSNDFDLGWLLRNYVETMDLVLQLQDMIATRDQIIDNKNAEIARLEAENANLYSMAYGE
jgi:hypothetical protein